MWVFHFLLLLVQRMMSSSHTTNFVIRLQPPSTKHAFYSTMLFCYLTKEGCVSSEFLTAVLRKSPVFWDVSLCHLMNNSWWFGGACCLHLQGVSMYIIWKLHSAFLEHSLCISYFYCLNNFWVQLSSFFLNVFCLRAQLVYKMMNMNIQHFLLKRTAHLNGTVFKWQQKLRCYWIEGTKH
jgi:hypothetical protein